MILTIITWFLVVLNFASALLSFGLLFNDDYRNEKGITVRALNVLYSIIVAVVLVLLS